MTRSKARGRSLVDSAKLAAGVAHKVYHAIQLDLEEQLGFGVYDFVQEKGALLVDSSNNATSSELWSFDPGLRYEQAVSAELLEPGNGGVEYSVHVPRPGDKRNVTIESRERIDTPMIDDDIFEGLRELEEHDHIWVEDD